MEHEENAYCRLCADIKLSGALSNLEIDVDKRREIFNKLARFNINLNFHNTLPKTVCYDCENNLNHAFDFVTTVDQAQEAFTDYIKKKEVVSEEESTDNEYIDFICDDDASIKEETNYDSSEGISKTIKIEYEFMKIEPNQNSDQKMVMNTKKSISRKNPEFLQEMELCMSWDEYVWCCSFCNKEFETDEQLRTHSMQFHCTCNAYTCYDCNIIFWHLDKFISHISMHRPFLILTCYKCSEQFSTTKEMKIHNTTHLDSDYVCIGCNATFSSQDELDEHKNAFYKDKNSRDCKSLEFLVDIYNDSLTCVICKKTLKSMLVLNRHLLIHTQRKRNQVCETCGKSFYNKKMLDQHLVVHSDERPHKCEVCKYSFKLLSELRKHVSIHFTPKPFACDKCGRCFRRRKELTVHISVHSNERPYVCSYCEKTFRFKHLLNQHIRMHTGVKPYTCDICARDFRNWSNCNKHMREQHGIDKSKRKRTTEGLYALDQATGEVIYPEEDKLLQWKNDMLKRRKLGRPKKTTEEAEP